MASPKFDAEAYKGSNVVEPSFNVLKQWRGLPVRQARHRSPTAAALASAPSSPGYANPEPQRRISQSDGLSTVLPALFDGRSRPPGGSAFRLARGEDAQ